MIVEGKRSLENCCLIGHIDALVTQCNYADVQYHFRDKEITSYVIYCEYMLITARSTYVCCVARYCYRMSSVSPSACNVYGL